MSALSLLLKSLFPPPGHRKDYAFIDADISSKLGLQRDGLYLYRHVLPPLVRNIAFVGAEVSGGWGVVAECLLGICCAAGAQHSLRGRGCRRRAGACMRELEGRAAGAQWAQQPARDLWAIAKRRIGAATCDSGLPDLVALACVAHPALLVLPAPLLPRSTELLTHSPSLFAGQQPEQPADGLPAGGVAGVVPAGGVAKG